MPSRIIERSEIENALSQFISALNAMDAQLLAKYFAPDITLFAPAGTPRLIAGVNEAHSHFERVFAAEPSSGPSVRPTNLDVVRLSPASALVMFEFSRASGSIGRRTIAFQRVENQWKVVHIHASNSKVEGDA